MSDARPLNLVCFGDLLLLLFTARPLALIAASLRLTALSIRRFLSHGSSSATLRIFLPNLSNWPNEALPRSCDRGSRDRVLAAAPGFSGFGPLLSGLKTGLVLSVPWGIGAAGAGAGAGVGAGAGAGVDVGRDEGNSTLARLYL